MDNSDDEILEAINQLGNFQKDTFKQSVKATKDPDLLLESCFTYISAYAGLAVGDNKQLVYDMLTALESNLGYIEL